MAVIPTKPQAQARTRLWAMPSAESHAACEELQTRLIKRDRPLAPKAVARLRHEWERRVTFDQCLPEHGCHLRTTHVVASPWAAGRRRTTAAQRVKQVDSATAPIGNVRQMAETTGRRRNAPARLPAVDAGAPSVDGIKHTAVNHQEVAA